MQTATILDIIAGEQSPKRVYKRLFYLSLVLVVLTTLALLFLNTRSSVNQTLSDYSRNLGRDIAQQYSSLIAASVSLKNTDQTSLFVQSLVQQSHIMAAKVYDQHGQMLVASPEEQDLVSLNNTDEAQHYITFIQPINHDERLVGYLRIIFDHGKIQENQHQLDSVYVLQTQLLMLFSALVAVMITRKFYVWRIRKFYVRKKHKDML